MEKEPIKSHEDLEVYKMAFDVAMKIFELSKKFPVEEKYSLTEEAGGRERGAGGKEFISSPATWFQAPGFIHG